MTLTQKVTRALGRRGPQERRLDLDETLAVHGGPECPVDLGPQPQVGLHGRSPEVDEPVPEADDLVDVDPVVDGEGWWFGGVEERHGALAQFDRPGGQIGIVGSRRTEPDRSFDRDHVLAADVDGPGHDALHDAGVVTQVDEGEVLAVLATLGDPPRCFARHRVTSLHIEHVTDVGRRSD